MPLLDVKVFRDYTYLHKQHAKIISGAVAGVRIATEDALDFVQDAVDNQTWVGHPYYPDVKPATKKWKAKHGVEDVLRITGNWITSFDTMYEDGGLTGIVSGGGHVKGADYTHLQKRWQMEKLWYEKRSMVARELIAQAVKKSV
jgi:hypothetical protein